jgi:hypothetical protein
MEARPLASPVAEHSKRSLLVNIAVHALGRKNVPNETRGNEIFPQFYFGLAASRNVRFSPALDVLPFCGLFHLTRPSSSRQRLK